MVDLVCKYLLAIVQVLIWLDLLLLVFFSYKYSFIMFNTLKIYPKSIFSFTFDFERIENHKETHALFLQSILEPFRFHHTV